MTGNELRCEREKVGIQATAIARNMGISQSAVSHAELGKHIPSELWSKRYMRALEVALEQRTERYTFDESGSDDS